MRIKIDRTTVILLVLIFLAITFFFNRFLIRKEIEEDKVKKKLYTIGRILSYHNGFKTSNKLMYEYVNKKGEIKEGGHSLSGFLAKKNEEYFEKEFFGRCFLVEFNTEYSWYNKLLINKPVPDSLYSCTNCYWDKIPW
ncbi:hypothetical protein H3Z83_02835 [Tenacibaculum sp. S7007]|uniref:Uncharacterized protein n=1 Tax=Tenacibaculum pelagium TaxID=2759527 RepID=A0A839AJZ5_9FLAO|nr:hypothetical protein [Tenacibaculum pelagium]MBA6155462.1 hypothetical protein [Tenacibaculum pelagium]